MLITIPVTEEKLGARDYRFPQALRYYTDRKFRK
jgi:hypothetical protein